MLERLDYVKLLPRRILDAGAGPSPQASQLARRYARAQLVALDFSLAMLRQSKPPGLLQRLTAGRRQVALCADIARIPLAARSIALVWSNMALHWAADLQTAIREFHRVLEVDGLLMFSTLGPDTLRELRSAFAGAGAQRHVHGFIDMHDLGDMLVHAGFADPVMDMESLTLTYADAIGLMRDLKATGAHNVTAGRPRGMMGRQRWQRMLAALEATRREGRLPTSFEVVYGHAWKPEPRMTDDGRAIIRVEPRTRQ